MSHMQVQIPPTKVSFYFLSTHFWPMFPFYTFGFLVFSRGIKWEHWPEMG